MTDTKKETAIPNNYFQTVVLTFNNGVRASFTGRAVTTPDENLNITAIQITEPAPLPEGCTFDDAEEPKKPSSGIVV